MSAKIQIRELGVPSCRWKGQSGSQWSWKWPARCLAELWLRTLKVTGCWAILLGTGLEGRNPNAAWLLGSQLQRHSGCQQWLSKGWEQKSQSLRVSVLWNSFDFTCLWANGMKFKIQSDYVGEGTEICVLEDSLFLTFSQILKPLRCSMLTLLIAIASLPAGSWPFPHTLSGSTSHSGFNHHAFCKNLRQQY